MCGIIVRYNWQKRKCIIRVLLNSLIMFRNRNSMKLNSQINKYHYAKWMLGTNKIRIKI